MQVWLGSPAAELLLALPTRRQQPRQPLQQLPLLKVSILCRYSKKWCSKKCNRVDTLQTCLLFLTCDACHSCLGRPCGLHDRQELCVRQHDPKTLQRCWQHVVHITPVVADLVGCTIDKNYAYTTMSIGKKTTALLLQTCYLCVNSRCALFLSGQILWTAR